MRVLILFGLVVTLVSFVSCRGYHFHQRDISTRKKYKDTKNKRGIADYPFGLQYSNPSLGSFHLPSAAAVNTYSHGLSGLSGYGQFGGANLYGNALGHNSYSLPTQTQSVSGLSSLGSFSQPAHGLSSLGSLSQANVIGLDSYNNLKPALTLSNSAQHLPSNSVNLASLLGAHTNQQSSYSSPSIGLFNPEKSGHLALLSQGSLVGSGQQSYKPLYATSQPLSASNFAVPVVLGSPQLSGHQTLNIPASPLSNLNSYGLTINSLTGGGNGLSYGASATPTQSTDTSNAASGNYILATAIPQQSGTAAAYNMPLTALLSSPSSATYTISVPPSYELLKNMSGSSGSSSFSTNYQMPMVSSAYVMPSSGSLSKGYNKYSPVSSEGSNYASSEQRPPSSSLKLSYSNPGMIFATPSSMTSGHSNSHSSKTSLSSSLKNSNSAMGSSSHSKHPVNSYGMPTMPYSFPSTSYGVSSQPISSSNYNSQSSSFTSSIMNPPSSSGSSSYSSIKNSFSYPSSYHQSHNPYKNSESSYKPSAMPYSETNSNYGYSNNEYSSENSNYKDSTNGPSSSSSSPFSNSIDNYSSQDPLTSYDDGTDSGSSYSSYYPRYQKYPPEKTQSYYDNEDSGDNSNYDTISYSVPIGKY